MADRPLWRLFWSVTDRLDYLMTLASLRVLDALGGPEPETPSMRSGSGSGSGIEIG